MKIKEKILIIWKDSVLSKVIAQGIIVLIPFVYVFIKNYYKDLSLVQILKNTFHYKIEFWIIMLSIIIIFVSFLIYKFSKPKIQKQILTEDHIKHDRELFQLIKDELQKQNTIEFIREFHWAGSFRLDQLEDFHFILDNINRPQITFIDTELDELRKKLFDVIFKFRSFLSKNSFPLNDGIFKVPSDWSYERPEKYADTIDRLNNLSDEIAKFYDKFIIMGKQKFGI